MTLCDTNGKCGPSVVRRLLARPARPHAFFVFCLCFIDGPVDMLFIEFGAGMRKIWAL
jgi:hypothetical protein